MTYKDVYKKFMIEYDKADISSSYPSLTIYEVATLLDKAMLALIAQKVTGNNPRRQTLDLDMKGVADLQTLIQRKEVHNFNKDNDYSNKYFCNIIDTEDILYITHVYLEVYVKPNDLRQSRLEEVHIIPQMYSYKFEESSTNKPWIKHPVCYIAGNTINMFIGKDMENIVSNSVYIDYIKCPDYFSDILMRNGSENESIEIFPLSDTMCEELINLAIIFACRTVGDPRISTEMQTKSLES